MTYRGPQAVLDQLADEHETLTRGVIVFARLPAQLIVRVGIAMCLFVGIASADEPGDAGVDAATPVPETQTEPTPTEATPPEPPEPPEPGDKSKKKKLSFGARVFTRATLAKIEDEPDVTGELDLKSARATADFRWRDFRGQIEVELAGKIQIKDAYAQLRLADEPKLDVRAGHFKMPFSAIQLESIWDLPMADRGLVDDVLVKRLQVAGRAVGAMVTLDLGAPTLRAGVFQGRNDAGDMLAATAVDEFGQNGVARLSIKPVSGVELGAGASARSGALLAAPIVIRHGYAGELDATADLEAGPGRVRAWIEAMIGTSWIVAGALPGHDLTRFLETRGIVAYRLGGEAKWKRYVEAYGVAAAMDPDRIIERDYVAELVGGISYGASEAWRIQLEAEVWRFGSAAPLGIAEFAVAPKDQTSLVLQLGARI